MYDIRFSVILHHIFSYTTSDFQLYIRFSVIRHHIFRYTKSDFKSYIRFRVTRDQILSYTTSNPLTCLTVLSYLLNIKAISKNVRLKIKVIGCWNINTETGSCLPTCWWGRIRIKPNVILAVGFSLNNLFNKIAFSTACSGNTKQRMLFTLHENLWEFNWKNSVSFKVFWRVLLLCLSHCLTCLFSSSEKVVRQKVALSKLRLDLQKLSRFVYWYLHAKARKVTNLWEIW